jgi:diguanylate cyclase (GGDEF)-like protein/PAS domain S-box-containing protein
MAGARREQELSFRKDSLERQRLAALLEEQNILLKQREGELREQNVKFETALSNMTQGLAMFDAEQRVIVANERYAKMYGLSLEQVKPGTTLHEILENRVANGIYACATPHEYIKQRLAISDGPSSKILKLNDGRTIANTGRPMAQGGWVTTHEDITEREKLKDRLDSALNNMAQGLAMFDAEQRLVLCNGRFAQMYGLLPEQIEPGPTVREVLAYCVANGGYAGKDLDEMLASTTKRLGSKSYYTTNLSNGRVYGVSIMPMSSGGIVTTHEDITERRRIEAHIAHLAHHDALTDLPNRVFLRTRLAEALISATRQGVGVAVLYLDLDGFKDVNDTLGHSVGDLLLKSVADRLRGCVREDDLVARLGGDEFAIVQIAADQPKSAAAVAARIMDSFAAPHVIGGHLLNIGTSIGIAVSPVDGSDPEQLLKNSDLALYGAKAEGRGTYRFFEPAMNTRMQARRAMESDLSTALGAGEFELHYQPILDLASDQICGCEALLRWNHPKRGKVSPVNFIPATEATGLIVPIGEWVLREACREAASWPSHLKVAVNLSAVQFTSRGLAQTVIRALADSGLSPRRLELEITESVLLSDSDAVLGVLKQLHDLGVRIALDDFGTGYSSLSYLRSFPFHKIKIDRCFVRDVTNKTPSSVAILRTVAQLGRTLGIATTAEGVETKGQLEIVRAEGCTETQGFLLSPPVAATAVRRLFSQHRERSANAA